mmetsp:Transcript_36727/g.79277  ORF Transcript_36727/g.79277 Transcript_36727/m.79277 type:complete len:81 (+) Transcript_36727:41-283(+)
MTVCTYRLIGDDMLELICVRAKIAIVCNLKCEVASSMIICLDMQHLTNALDPVKCQVWRDVISPLDSIQPKAILRRVHFL